MEDSRQREEKSTTEKTDHISKHPHHIQKPKSKPPAKNRSVPEAESGKVPEEKQHAEDGTAKSSRVPLVKPLHGDGLHQTHAVSKRGTAMHVVLKTVTDFTDIWMAAKHISIWRIRSKPIP